MSYEIHPVANIFPPMAGAEFQALKSDIEQHGQREPIWLYDGKVIDGRHRLRACVELALEPRTVEYDGDDVTAFVVSLNLHRRHLDESQRAMVGARLANISFGEYVGNQHEGSANLPTPAISQAKAAEMLSVSTRAVTTAAKVQAKAAPEVVQAVDRGEMSVSLAAKVVDLPDSDQDLIVALNEDPQRMREMAREVVHNHRAQGTGENEWYTPEEYIEAARLVMGSIDLDPASSEIANARVKAAKFYTQEDDGLSKNWTGNVWLNPPYAQPAIQHFAEKMAAEIDCGRVSQAVMLTHNYTDTRWFHLSAERASAICFTRGRIGFLSPEGKRAAPTQGQAFFYYGDNVDRFADVFSKFGFVVEMISSHEAQQAEAA